MALELYTSADIQAHILAVLVLALDAANSGGRLSVDYCAGIVAMARSTAIAHHIEWGDLAHEARAAIGADIGDLLDAVPMRVLENGG